MSVRCLYSVIFACAIQAQSTQPIPVFNTAVDASGQRLPIGAVDPHYKLMASADSNFPGPDAYVTQPFVNWIQAGLGSGWIAPTANAIPGNAIGNYTYRLTFSLSGFDSTTAILTGRWSSDNAGVDIKINGVSTGNTNPFGANGHFSYTSFSNFSVTSGFVAGCNTLDFIVNNAPTNINPTGLLVEISGHAQTVGGSGAPASSCSCPVKVTLTLGQKPGEPPQTSMDAVFTPPPNMTIDEYRLACGFDEFNWQQVVEFVPPPSPYLEVGLPGGGPIPLTAGHGVTFFDPPPRGYAVPKDPSSAYPFYYDSRELAVNPIVCATDQLEGAVVPSTGALCFHDAPADPCLAGGNPDLRAKYCGGNSAEPGAALLFSTALVGVNQAYPEGQVLKQWTWLDNFNGTADGFIVILSNPGGVDPGSGSGGVTITSIDGVLLTNIPSTQIATTASGLAYSRANQTFNGSVEITNISGSTISAPSNGFFQVLFTSLPIGVTLSNASGAFNGSPFITISALARLTPGQSAIVNVQFKNSSAQPINFTPMIYTGRF